MAHFLRRLRVLLAADRVRQAGNRPLRPGAAGEHAEPRGAHRRRPRRARRGRERACRSARPRVRLPDCAVLRGLASRACSRISCSMRPPSRRVFGPTTSHRGLPRRRQKPGGRRRPSGARTSSRLPGWLAWRRCGRGCALCRVGREDDAGRSEPGDKLCLRAHEQPHGRARTAPVDARADARPRSRRLAPAEGPGRHAAPRGGPVRGRPDPGSDVKVLPGRDYLPWVGDQESIVAEVGRFVTGVAPAREPDRVLLTVLFTDMVDSTKRAAEPVTSAGGSCWGATTPLSAVTSTSTAGARSIARVTAS